VPAVVVHELPLHSSHSVLRFQFVSEKNCSFMASVIGTVKNRNPLLPLVSAGSSSRPTGRRTVAFSTFHFSMTSFLVGPEIFCPQNDIFKVFKA